MDDTHFRLIFQGVDETAQLEKLVAFFLRELSLSEKQIRDLLPKPPRILRDAIPPKDAELIQTSLENMGCSTAIEPVIADPSYPFIISKKHQKVINAELSKILRCSANLTLFLAQVESREAGPLLPSMMGSFPERVAAYLRESDTVIGIDDSRVIALGFATDRDGVEVLQNKINRTLKELLGEKPHISMGFALFPEEGRSLSELIQLAELKRLQEDTAGIGGTPVSAPAEGHRTPFAPNTDETASTPLQLCFTEARGKIFNRLLTMDATTLWLGLSQLPQAKQKDFLARLPYDAPLAPTLKEMIDNQSEPISDKAAEQHFEAIIHQMKLDEGLEERKRVQEELFSRLDRVDTLPTLPSVAALVFKIATDPTSSAGELTKVIENDLSLTSKLLKTVNSAFYGFPQKIGTVRQAVVILGLDEITNLAFGLAAAKVFETALLEGLYDPKSLWHHSICTALIAQKLCERLPGYQRLGAFTAGLLHDFGKILLIESFPELYGQIYGDVAKHDFPLFELEEERIGVNHAVVGKLLSSNWNLPESLVEAIAYHHQPLSAPSHSHLAAITGLADYLYYHATAAGNPTEEILVMSPQLTYGHWSSLTEVFTTLDAEQLKQMMNDALAVIENSDDLLNVLD